MSRACRGAAIPASHSRSPWVLAIYFFFSLFICLCCLPSPSPGQERRCSRAEFSPASSKSGWRLLAAQAGTLNSFVKLQLRDHRAALRAQGVRVCLAAPGRSRWAPGCLRLAESPRLSHPRQGFGRLPRWRRSCLRGFCEQPSWMSYLAVWFGCPVLCHRLLAARSGMRDAG